MEWSSFPTNTDSISLRKQKIRILDSAICQFRQLRYLDLGKNKLNTLPPCMKQLPIQTLILEKNGFGRIPLVIREMNHLLLLNMGGNSLDSIPAWLPELKHLKTLIAYDNNLSYFPRELRIMTTLRVMDLGQTLYNRDEMSLLESSFPKIEILFSPPCSCPSSGVVIY
ncbi:MAG: leucine-rich repeat protein SHOC2 [Luteibaculaceae bacterium]